MENTKVKIKLNYKKLIKNKHHPGLYIEKKRRRFVFYKRVYGKEFIFRVPFREIKTEEDYDMMLEKWKRELSRGAEFEIDRVLGFLDDAFFKSYSDFAHIARSQGLDVDQDDNIIGCRRNHNQCKELKNQT